jgi:hypothetical protein
MSSQPLADRARAFLFAPVDPVAAGAFRLAFALVLVVLFRPRVLDLSTSHWVSLAAAWLAFAAGVTPRAAGFALVGLLLPLAGEPGLTVSRQVLLFSLLAFSFVRSGAALSLPGGIAPGRPAGPAWPIRLMQIQLSMLYGVNALAKTTPHFLSGDTLVALSLLPNFRVDLSGGTLAAGGLALPVWLLAAGVTLVEYALAIGWWFPRLRPATAALGLVFHGALTQVVNIGLLHVASIFLYASFLLPLIQSVDQKSPPAR